MMPPTPPSMSLPIPAARQNADPAELAKFAALAHRWWDPESEFRPLHEINPLRLGWIDRLCPLRGKAVADVGNLHQNQMLIGRM